MPANSVMRAVVRLTIAAIVMLTAPVFAADTLSNLDGTWSGDWTIKGGVPTAVTVQLSVEKNTLSGTFLSPARMECSTSTFAAATKRVVLEATDKASSTRYRLVGKLSGTEIVGTFDGGDETGTIRLVKWTYVPSTFR